MKKWGNEELTDKIINACINVHKALDPGFVESVYRNALLIELTRQLLAHEAEKEVKISYGDSDVGLHKLDLLVAGEIIVELKAVETLHKKHYAQVRSYLKAAKKKIGLLVNFDSYTLDVRRVGGAQAGNIMGYRSPFRRFPSPFLLNKGLEVSWLYVTM